MEAARKVDFRTTKPATPEGRSVESMFRTIDEKLELILDAQDARFRMLDDKLERFNRRMDNLERHSECSPRTPAPVVEDELNRSAFDPAHGMRRRLGSLDTASVRRQHDDTTANSLETLRYIHERLASLETQTQALPDKVTPSIHRRLDTLETQVKILPDRVDTLLRQLQSRLKDQSTPLHALTDPQRHHTWLARTEESISAMHRTLESLEMQGRNLPDRVSLAVSGGKFGNYTNRAYSSTDETLGYIQSRLESLEKQIDDLPERFPRGLDDDQLHAHLVPLETQLKGWPDRMHELIKEVVTTAITEVIDHALVAVHVRLESMEKESNSHFDRLGTRMDVVSQSMKLDQLPKRWHDTIEALVNKIVTTALRHHFEKAAAVDNSAATATAVVGQLDSRFKPLETHLQGLPQVLHLALEDNVSVVAMVVNDALAMMHRRLDTLESLPTTLQDVIKQAVKPPSDDKPIESKATTPPPPISSNAKASSNSDVKPAESKKTPLPPPMETRASRDPPVITVIDSPPSAPQPVATRLRRMPKQPSSPEAVTTKSKPAFVPRKRRTKETTKSTPPPKPRPTFVWSDGSVHNAPEDWVFPITNCRALWELWFIGDPVNRIGPYRLLTKSDIKHTYVLKTRGKAAAVVQKIIDTAVDHAIVASVDALNNLPPDACMSVFEKAFLVLMGHASAAAGGGHKVEASILPQNAGNNMFTTIYTMLVNQKRKRSESDEG
ncbi:hypothetical protein LEN26_014817 [Aphanomyces euteiches]|nr:hypothetical protein AeMF1_021315 [Aphanomyces euteiches]KAH9105299.1 hypothetical protein LEN26_014817 [Aphanomyces euteiches]KAH9194301.1 hypothetical protein AeNC1_003719 [Aphanomyces euteiches]